VAPGFVTTWYRAVTEVGSFRDGRGPHDIEQLPDEPGAARPAAVRRPDRGAADGQRGQIGDLYLGVHRTGPLRVVQQASQRLVELLRQS
jgi:hypothetical protein